MFDVPKLEPPIFTQSSIVMVSIIEIDTSPCEAQQFMIDTCDCGDGDVPVP